MSSANLQEDGKSRRPPDTGLHQQRLSAWKPVMNAKSVAPLLLVWGLVCLPLGVVVVILSANLQEVVVDYTDCVPPSWNETAGFSQTWPYNNDTNTTNVTYYSCADWVGDVRVTATYNSTCLCVLNFTIPTTIPGPVYVYYGLTNFYQNHRRIWRSRDDFQLSGVSGSPFTFCSLDSNPPSANPPYAPCGGLANAFFNDSFGLSQLSGSSYVTVAMNTSNINLYYDTLKYKNPSGANATEKFSNTQKLPNWPNAVYEYGYDDATGNQTIWNGSVAIGVESVTDWTKVGYSYPQFVNWMHSSALPDFWKQTAVIDASVYPSGIPAGDYQLSITYNYPVAAFGGRKQFILATNSWLGGTMPLLGYMLIATGSLYLLFGIAFVITHFRMAHQLVVKYGLDHDDLDPDLFLD